MDTTKVMTSDISPLISIWSLIRSYLTPTTLFLLLNLVIGTIALTSRSYRRRDEHIASGDDLKNHLQHPNPPPPPLALARTPSSLLEHLRSFNLYHFQSGDFPPEYNQPNPNSHPIPEEQHFVKLSSESKQNQHHHSNASPHPPALARIPSSILERLRSFNLYRFCSGDFQPEYNQPHTNAEPIPEDQHFRRSWSEMVRPVAKGGDGGQDEEGELGVEAWTCHKKAGGAAARDHEIRSDRELPFLFFSFSSPPSLPPTPSLLPPFPYVPPLTTISRTPQKASASTRSRELEAQMPAQKHQLPPPAPTSDNEANEDAEAEAETSPPPKKKRGGDGHDTEPLAAV